MTDAELRRLEATASTNRPFDPQPLFAEIRRLRAALKRVGLAVVCGGTEDVEAIPDLVNEALS